MIYKTGKIIVEHISILMYNIPDNSIILTVILHS